MTLLGEITCSSLLGVKGFMAELYFLTSVDASSFEVRVRLGGDSNLSENQITFNSSGIFSIAEIHESIV